jgi:PAS domain S-box-containing protein
VIRPGRSGAIGLLELDLERREGGGYVALLRDGPAEPVRTHDPGLFEAIVRHAPDAITVLQPDGKQRYASPGGTRVLGYAPGKDGELSDAGLPGYLLVHPDDLAGVQEQFRSRSAGSLAWHSPFRYRIFAGEPDRWRWVETTLLDLRDVEPVQGYVGFTRDVTADEERRRLLAESQQRLGQLLASESLARRHAETRADDLAELDRIRSLFVSATSHELRTPLTSILAAVAHLRTGESDVDELNRYHELIERNALRLTRLVDDLLQVMRLESGMIELDAEALDLAAVVTGLVSDHLAEARRKGVRILADVRPGPPLTGDGTRLSRAISNLLANAVKFAPSGSEVSVVCNSYAGGWELRVRNRGPAIPEQDRERVFEPFYRSSNVKDVPGSGLGLAIARRVIDLHGGSLAVVDEPDWSTVLRCSLPFASSQPSRTVTAPLF